MRVIRKQTEEIIDKVITISVCLALAAFVMLVAVAVVGCIR